jgi:micrococcal nuclease
MYTSRMAIRMSIARGAVGLALALAAGLSAAAEPARPVQKGRVEWVSDGDTITVRLGEGKEKVRLVGIDTPELDDANPFWRNLAIEARDYAKSRLLDRTVVLEPDPVTADRDKYDRLLRYVALDGKDFNEEMVRKGYARVYTRFPFARLTQYKAAEKAAREAKAGRWARGH